MVTKLLKRAIPAPLHPPVRRAVLFVIPLLQRRLRRIRHRHNRLNRRVRRKYNRLKRRIRLSILWLKRLKQQIWLYVWSWRRRNRPPVGSSNQIHLINPLTDYTGSPQRTLHLFDELKNHTEVCLWSNHKPAPEIAEKYPVKQIIPWRFQFPQSGTFVVVSPQNLEPWIYYARPRRTILVQNSTYMTPSKFRERLWPLSNKGRRKVEVVYASELAKRLVDYPGFIQASLVDLDRFVPAASRPSGSAAAGFTVGRLSRADPNKHHPDDAALYRWLVEHGCRIKIMGPSTSLKAELRGLESVELLPMFSQEAHLFLQGLECFFYRTSEKWVEPSGRVITEAMACGLPVVCHNRGGYAEWIDHGRNGFLFDTQQEALEVLLRLKEDRVLRESVGKAARETAEGLFSPAVRSEIVEFYLR